MVWGVVIVTVVVGVLAVPLVLVWWRPARSAFQYPDEENEAAAAQAPKDTEMIVQLRQTTDADGDPRPEPGATTAHRE